MKVIICTFVCSPKYSGHQQDNAFKGSRASKDNSSTCYSPTKTEVVSVQQLYSTAGIWQHDIVTSYLPHTHISDNCTKEQSYRSTMSLLHRLKAPTLRSTAKKHWYWALGKTPLGVKFIFCGYVLLHNVWIMWFALFHEMKDCSAHWFYPWHIWIDPAPKQSPWTL